MRVPLRYLLAESLLGDERTKETAKSLLYRELSVEGGMNVECENMG